MNKIKILTITTSGLGKKEGISKIIFDYYSHFDNNKFQLDIIASGNYNYQLIKEFETIGVIVRCLPSRKESMMKYIKAFIKLFKQERYDAVYIHGSSAIMCMELILAKMYGCKTRVVHSHNTTCTHVKADKLLRPIFYRSYTKALACGNDAGQWLYGKRPFDIIKNGRNVDVYKYNENVRHNIRNKLGIADDTTVIGHVGSFNKQKNQKYLLAVLKEFIKLNTNIKLYFIGDGKTRQSIMNDVEIENLSEYVEFMGFIANVQDMLQAMDVMLLPSLYEGLPLVVVEWQIAGLPCIVSDQVTKECAFTDLVHFLPLSENYQNWALKILELSKEGRSENSELLLRLASENGYNLKENVEKLQQYFYK